MVPHRGLRPAHLRRTVLARPKACPVFAWLHHLLHPTSNREFGRAMLTAGMAGILLALMLSCGGACLGL